MRGGERRCVNQCDPLHLVAVRVRPSRREISAVKVWVRRAGPDGYSALLRAVRHPEAAARLRGIPGSRMLMSTAVALAPLHLLLSVAAGIVALAAAPWWEALLTCAVMFLLINVARTEIHLELGGRLIASERGRRSEERKAHPM